MSVHPQKVTNAVPVEPEKVAREDGQKLKQIVSLRQTKQRDRRGGQPFLSSNAHSLPCPITSGQDSL